MVSGGKTEGKRAPGASAGAAAKKAAEASGKKSKEKARSAAGMKRSFSGPPDSDPRDPRMTPSHARACNLALLLLKCRRKGLTREDILKDMREQYFTKEERDALNSPDTPRAEKERLLENKRKMFLRDRRRLEEMGFIVRTKGAKDLNEVRYYIDPEDLEFDPRSLNALDLVFLRLALGSMRAVGGLHFTQELRSVQRKLRVGDASQREEGEVRPLFINAPAGKDSVIFEQIHQAIQEKKPITFRYRGAKDDGYKERRAQPVALSFQWGSWHLLAYDLDRLDYRDFRLSNIEHRKGTLRFLEGVPWTELADEPQALRRLRGRKPWQFGEGEEREVVVEFDPLVEERAQRLLGDTASWSKGKRGRPVAAVKASSLENLASWLLRFGEDARVLRPVEAKRALVSALKGALAAAEGGENGGGR